MQNCSLTAHWYIEKILLQHVVSFAPFIGQNVLLIHDNIRPHVAQCVSDYLQEVGISTVDCPSRSPYLNSIEHVLDMIGCHIRYRVFTTMAQLREALKRQWEELPQEDIRDLIKSMPKRLAAANILMI